MLNEENSCGNGEFSVSWLYKENNVVEKSQEVSDAGPCLAAVAGSSVQWTVVLLL